MFGGFATEETSEPEWPVGSAVGHEGLVMLGEWCSDETGTAASKRASALARGQVGLASVVALEDHQPFQKWGEETY